MERITAESMIRHFSLFESSTLIGDIRIQMSIEVKLEAIVLTCNFDRTALWELCEEQ